MYKDVDVLMYAAIKHKLLKHIHVVMFNSAYINWGVHIHTIDAQSNIGMKAQKTLSLKYNFVNKCMYMDFNWKKKLGAGSRIGV